MRYSGKIGYCQQTEIAPGVWEDVITEHEYIGDVVQRTETFSLGDNVLPQYRTTTSVSVLSLGVDKANYENIRYVNYAGHNWDISSVVYNWPRLVIYIGDKYHGPTPASP